MGGRHRLQTEAESAAAASAFHLRDASSVIPRSGPIMFVCTGNLARSAFAQHHSSQLLGTPELFASAGTSAVVGQSMHPELAALFPHPPHHHARQATGSILHSSPLIIVMAKQHLSWIADEAPELTRRTFLFQRCALALTRQPPSNPLRPHKLSQYIASVSIPRQDIEDIPDPINGPPEQFTQCALTIDAGLRAILPWIDTTPESA